MRQPAKTRRSGTTKVIRGVGMPNKLERDVKYLKVYASVSTLLLAILLLTGFAETQQKQKFGEIDVERINIVEKDGKLDLVISNSDRMPPAIVNGKTFKNGTRSPGL